MSMDENRHLMDEEIGYTYASTLIYLKSGNHRTDVFHDP